MFCQLLAISLALVTCDAQEHLTCLRTDNVINPSPQPSPTGIQGRPGRRGPRGEKGESIVGMKGEPGIPDNSLIESLRGNSNQLCIFFIRTSKICVEAGSCFQARSQKFAMGGAGLGVWGQSPQLPEAGGLGAKLPAAGGTGV